MKTTIDTLLFLVLFGGPFLAVCVFVVASLYAD